MSASRRTNLIVRWSAGVMLALGVHIAGAAALLARWQDETEDVASAPVILIELAPVAAAPAVPLEQAAPGPLAPQAEDQPTPDKPIEKTEVEPTPEKPPEKAIAVTPAPKPELSVLPPPKPPEKKVEKKPQQRHASLPTAPSPAEQKAERAVAPAPGAISHNANALPNWKSALVARLERYKRYPDAARGDHGVAQLAFSVDRSGAVHGARIVRSSGSALLDRAAVELVERAAPLPPPPPDVAGAQIAIVVPIRYNSR